MGEPIISERRLEEQGFRLGTDHRDKGLEIPERSRFWHPSFRAGYDAGRLEEGSRVALQVMLACHSSLPILDLRGDLTEARIINAQGTLTDRGRTLARILLAET